MLKSRVSQVNPVSLANTLTLNRPDSDSGASHSLPFSQLSLWRPCKLSRNFTSSTHVKVRVLYLTRFAVS